MACYKDMLPRVTCFCTECKKVRFVEQADYSLMLNREIDKRGTFKVLAKDYWVYGHGRVFA